MVLRGLLVIPHAVDFGPGVGAPGAVTEPPTTHDDCGPAAVSRQDAGDHDRLLEAGPSAGDPLGPFGGSHHLGRPGPSAPARPAVPHPVQGRLEAVPGQATLDRQQAGEHLQLHQQPDELSTHGR